MKYSTHRKWYAILQLPSLIFILILGIGAMIFLNKFLPSGAPENYVEVQSTIKEIVVVPSEYADESDSYTVILEYEYGGEYYQVDSGTYSFTMKEGDEKTIYIDPAEPTEVYVPYSKFVFMLLPIIFVVVGVVGIGMNIWRIRMSKLEAQNE